LEILLRFERTTSSSWKKAFEEEFILTDELHGDGDDAGDDAGGDAGNDAGNDRAPMTGWALVEQVVAGLAVAGQGEQLLEQLLADEAEELGHHLQGFLF
jgi:hypothetical protein